MRFQPPIVQRAPLSGAVVGLLAAVSLIPSQQPVSQAHLSHRVIVQQATPGPGIPIIDPPLVEGTLTPASMMQHEFFLSNEGESRDRFHLEVRPNEGQTLTGITTNISPPSVILEPGSTIRIGVTVFARSTTQSGVDRRTLRVVSSTNPDRFAEALMITTVVRTHKVTLPSVFSD